MVTVYCHVNGQLTLEEHGFKVCGSTHTQGCLDKHSQPPDPRVLHPRILRAKGRLDPLPHTTLQKGLSICRFGYSRGGPGIRPEGHRGSNVLQLWDSQNYTQIFSCLGVGIMWSQGQLYCWFELPIMYWFLYQFSWEILICNFPFLYCFCLVLQPD